MKKSDEQLNVPGIEYRYKCIDKSILLPYFKKYYFPIVYQWVPRKLTANWVTLISCGAVWVIFLLSFLTNPFDKSVLAFLFFVLTHFYFVGDHLDGMHAKATGTSSPLGEYLDHYLDIYNSAILIAACLMLLQIENPCIFYLMMWLSHLAFAATMVEEKETGELYFGPIGTVEARVLLQILFLTWMIPSQIEYWQAIIWNELPRYWIIILVIGFGFLLTVLDIVKRLGYCPRQFSLFSFGSLFLTLALIENPPSQIIGWFILAFYSGDYIGRVMDSHLLRKKHPYPDFAATLIIIILFIINRSHIISRESSELLMIVFGIYIGFKCIRGFTQTFRNHGAHWKWKNL
jgi:phosphatidylglycerophosphate synthase